MIEKLSRKLKKLPVNPGVYLFKDRAGDVLYVGKAKNLRNRVRSYFTSSHDVQPRTRQLVATLADLEYIICDTEVESLMLENNLIKKYQPRYNVLLRDDKNFQFIVIDYTFEIPQIYTARKISESKNKATRYAQHAARLKYFGPYTSAASVRQTLRLLRYIFPYCSNKKVGSRPCFYFHLGRCPGVCAGLVSVQEYRETLARIERFLHGDFQKLMTELKKHMATAAARKQFERAARLRDQVRALEVMLQKQKIISPRRETHDVISLVQAANLSAVNLFQIRNGKLIGREQFLLDNAKGAPAEEILETFILGYYLKASDVPAEINLPRPVPAAAALGSLLTKRLKKPVRFTAPQRGRKRKLLTLGEKNASEYLDTMSQNLGREQAILTRSLFELKTVLGLPTLPLRIECFDISNIQGVHPVGSMVTFENGKPKKADYRRFAVRSLSTPNDVAMMREVLERRFAHAGAGMQSRAQWRLPDLVVVDGGRAQLNAALSVLKTRRLRLPAVALAKRLEEIHSPNRALALRLPADSAALQLLQRIRDEAHRFAIIYHRKKRSRGLLTKLKR